MTVQKLEELINAGEGEKLDYKEQLLLDTETKKKEFAKDVTAIANTKGGRGYLVFGVADKNTYPGRLMEPVEITNTTIAQHRIVLQREHPKVIFLATVVLPNPLHFGFHAGKTSRASKLLG